MKLPGGFTALWGAPLALAVLTLVGLIGALWGDGAWDLLGWVGLAAPCAVCLWFGLRGR